MSYPAAPVRSIPEVKVVEATEGDANLVEQLLKVSRIAVESWYGVAAHRPLGSVMRTRRVAYKASTALWLARMRCPVSR